MRSHFLTSFAATFIATASAFALNFNPPNFNGNDFVTEAQSVRKNINDQQFNDLTCEPYLKSVVAAIQNYDMSKADRLKLIQQSQQILDVMWGIRLDLHDKVGDLSLSAKCVDSVKATFRSMRAIEDYLGEFVYPNIRQIRAESIDFKTQPIPLKDVQAYPKFHINPKYASAPLDFQSGDIMITKGVSFLSSTISTIPDVTSQYSHIVLVHVDQKSKEVKTLESYVGPGFSAFTIDDALRDENARILVLRPKDLKIGRAAADFMMNRYLDSVKNKTPVQYDYNLDFKDHSTLTCAEVAEQGYEEVTGGKLILPMFQSHISLKNDKFLSSIGLKQGPIFTPIDMETDPRFEMVLEWRDQRLMRDSRYKDAVAHSMLKWMNNLGYELRTPTKLWLQTEFIAAMRHSDLTWSFAKKVGGGDVTDAMRTIPLKTLRSMGTLKLVATNLLNVLYDLDAQFIKKQGWPMTNVELEKALSQFRSDDYQRYLGGQKKGSFHNAFRPRTAEEKTP